MAEAGGRARESPAYGAPESSATSSRFLRSRSLGGTLATASLYARWGDAWDLERPLRRVWSVDLPRLGRQRGSPGYVRRFFYPAGKYTERPVARTNGH